MGLQHFTLHHITLLPYTLCMDMHRFTLVYIYIYIVFVGAVEEGVTAHGAETPVLNRKRSPSQYSLSVWLAVMCDLGSRVMQKVHPLRTRSHSSTKKQSCVWTVNALPDELGSVYLSSRGSHVHVNRPNATSGTIHNRQMARQSRACHRKNL